MQKGSDIANFRRVCKACKKASKTFTGPIRINAPRVRDPLQLSRVSAILPGLQDLTSKALFTEAQSGIHTFTALSSLSLDEIHWNGRVRAFNLACLPLSLKALNLGFFHLDPQSCQSMKCVGLTRLALRGTGNTTTETRDILQYLPELEVSLSCTLLALVWMRTQSRS